MNKVSPLFQVRTSQQQIAEDFGELYKTYWERLFLQIIRILPNENEAADVVQQTFVNLWEMRDRIPQIHNLKSFVFIMARNLAFKRLKENLKEEGYRNFFAAHYQSAVSSTEDHVEYRELSLLMDSYIEKLPDRMKEVFLLSRKSDLSHAEIAEKLNISHTTVKKQISNALKILRLSLQSQYFPYLYFLFFSLIL